VSAKLTVILFIMICFEIGCLLVFLPWHRSWDDNNLLYLAVETFDAPQIRDVVISGWCRGMVTGLGVINVLIGIWEIRNFSTAVRALGGDETVSDH
jgi:hypothetical protein